MKYKTANLIKLLMGLDKNKWRN